MEGTKKKSEKKFVFFISFDLVNSTSYKLINKNWIERVEEFYDIIRSLLTIPKVKKNSFIYMFRNIYMKLFSKDSLDSFTRIFIENNPHIIEDGLNIWKMLGDEIILEKEFTSYQVMQTYLNSVLPGLYYFLEKINILIESKTDKKMGVKSCAWIAEILSKKNDIKYDVSLQDKIFESIDKKKVLAFLDPNRIKEGPKEFIEYFIDEFTFNKFINEIIKKIPVLKDYLGKHIDAGFRLSKFSEKNRMVVSFELAKLLAKNDGLINNLFFVGYEELKGVWDGENYPIIWFHDNNQNEFINSFHPVNKVIDKYYLFYKDHKDQISIKTLLDRLSAEYKDSLTDFENI